VDIHTAVTSKRRIYSGEAQSGRIDVQQLTSTFMALLLLVVTSAQHLCPKIRHFAH